ncbi:MAG: MBG domain-containing protein [Janthinobacterium lividum]
MFLHKNLLATIVLLLVTSTCIFAQTFGTYKNTATATATASGGVVVSDISNNGSTLNQPSGVQTPINFPMIGLGKTASAPVLQSDGTYNVDYTITVKNFGQIALQNVQVQDVLTTAFPSPVTYTLRSAVTISGGTGLTVNTSFTGANTYTNLLVAASSTLAIGDSRTITIPLNVNLNGAFGTFNNTATTSATTADNTSVFDTSNNSSNPDGNGDGNPFNDSAPTPVMFNSPDIQVLKTASNLSPTAGTNVTFTITAKNNGLGDAANVTITDVLNSGYSYISAAPSAGTYNAATGIWSVGNIANGISQTLTITAKVLYSKPVAAYQNTASSNYLGDNTPANNSQTVNVTPVQLPPDALNDAITGIPATASATLNLLTNDKLADGSAATIPLVTVDIDPAIAGIQNTFNVTGQGVWTYNTSTGDITFNPATGFLLSPAAITYTLTETATGLTDQATITVTKAANTDVTLNTLILNNGTLTPAFTSSNPNYTVQVPYTTASINLTATANDANASIRINNAMAVSGSATALVALNVGSNPVNVAVTAHDGISRQTYTVTVTREKAPQTITFAALATKTFGDTDFPLVLSSTNTTIPITYVSDNLSVATIVNGNVHVVGAGTANITASQAGNASYNAAADVIQILTVNPASQTISFATSITKIYGDAGFALTAISSSGLPVNFSSADASIASISGSTVTIYKAGTVIITASQPGNSNYNAATAVNSALIINPKTLTAALTGTVTKIYDGNTNAVFTASNFTLSRKIGTDDVSLINPTSGTYNNRTVNTNKQVSASGLSLAGNDATNYVLASTALTANMGTITPAVLTLNLTGTVTKVYDGNTLATLVTANYQLSGVIGNDQVNFNKPTSGIYDNSSAGTGKMITINNIVLSGADADNYSLSSGLISANIGVINTKTISISAGNQTKIYGAANPALTFSYNGFANGESVVNLITLPTISTTATANSPVGTYPISVSGAASNNYDFNYVNGTLTISQNNNVITFAALPAKTYGDSNFDLTATASSGLPVTYISSNPTVAAVDGTGKVQILSAGTATITAQQTGNSNYNPAASVQQILVINKASLTVIADDQTKIYGASNAALTAHYNGFVNGESEVNLITLPTISTTATANSPVGTYLINVSGAASSNYNFVYVNGALTVNPTVQTITFVALPSKTYGDASFVWSATASSGLPVTYTSSNPAVATMDAAGIVHIVAAGTTSFTALQSGNTNFAAAAAVAQDFRVIKTALTISADDKTRIYGLPNPALTFTYNGFVNRETVASLTNLPTISTTATATSAAGTYPIILSGAASTNYSFVYIPGTLTVAGAAVNSLTLTQTTLPENQSAGTAAGTLSASALDPNAVFTYSFIAGNGGNDNSLFSIQGNKVLATTAFDYEVKSSYSVRIRATSQYGLSFDQSFTIQITDVNEAPTLATVSNRALCYTPFGQSIRLSNISGGPESGQTVTLSVSSSNPGLFGDLSVSAASNGNATLNYQLAATGTAVVTVTVQDNGGTANRGTDSFSQSFTITSNEMPVVAITADKSTQISKGETVTLTASGGSVYSWDTTPNVSGSSSSAIIKVRPSQTTTYQVKVSNASGCSDTKSITINVADDYASLHASNLLTPDGDGKNDTWVVKNIDLYPDNTVSIFDKGGRKLLEVKHYDNSWDGTFRGSPLTEGTYYYIIDFGPGKAPMKGFITILRTR